jgi:hypothetical protein
VIYKNRNTPEAYDLLKKGNATVTLISLGITPEIQDTEDVLIGNVFYTLSSGTS